jgi:hypothetical protein
MVVKSRNYFILFGCLFIFTTLAASKIKAMKAPKQESPTCSNATIETLRQLGAKQLDSLGNKFELNDGIILSITCDEKALAVIQVRLTNTNSLGYNGDSENIDVSSKSQYCCLSKIAYDNLIKIINQLGPLGQYRRQNPISIIGPTGWIRKTDEFAHANIVKLERTGSVSYSNSGIAAFTVFYWLPLSGKVESKRVEIVEANQFIKKIRYLITVYNTEVEVSGEDYQRIGEGQVVELERAVNSLARIVAIRDIGHDVNFNASSSTRP